MKVGEGDFQGGGGWVWMWAMWCVNVGGIGFGFGRSWFRVWAGVRSGCGPDREGKKAENVRWEVDYAILAA